MKARTKERTQKSCLKEKQHCAPFSVLLQDKYLFKSHMAYCFYDLIMDIINGIQLLSWNKQKLGRFCIFAKNVCQFNPIMS